MLENHWPASHIRVVRYLAGLAAKGTRIYYLTGNLNELPRKFAGLRLGQFQLANKLVLDLPHGRTWLFHGDVFDVRCAIRAGWPGSAARATTCWFY